MLDIIEDTNLTRQEKLSKLIYNMKLEELGLLSVSRHPLFESPQVDEIFLKTIVATALIEYVSTSVQGLVVRTLEPILDLKKGLGTKRHIMPEKFGDPIPDIPENEPERFLGKDLESNDWIQDYMDYDIEQEFEGELSIYTTNHFIGNKDRDPKKIDTWNKKLKDAPQKSYLITGIQIMSDYKPMADFIKIQKKHMKTIDVVSTETIWAQPNRFYEFRTPIVFNPDMDVVFCFDPWKTYENHVAVKRDNIRIHGWICEPIGKTIMG